MAQIPYSCGCVFDTGIVAWVKVCRGHPEGRNDVNRQFPQIVVPYRPEEYRGGLRLDPPIVRPVKKLPKPDHVEPINIDRYLGVPRNRVSLVGIELEGGWKKFPSTEKYATDSSVFKTSKSDVMRQAQDMKCGEMTSDPMVPGHMPLWMKRNYPDLMDSTCGLHIHMSFEDCKNYTRLMVPQFQATVIGYLKKWAYEEALAEGHPIWDRLAGDNEFCNLHFFADKQVNDRRKDYDHFREGNRYTAVAYRFGTHKTVEVRVLPMFDKVETSVKALWKVIHVTNAFLVTVANREETLMEKVVGPGVGKVIIERDVEVV